jgi:hypothetical protein
MGNYKLDDAGCDRQDRAITAIREALAQPEHHPQHSHTLPEMYAELHLYEEINRYYALCNPGAANLRDWVAERMDKPVQPVQPKITEAAIRADEREACAKICEQHADVYASLAKTLTTEASWAVCIDNRDTIRARGQA